jgi:phenazine biosynthesis protein PhzF family
MSIPLVWVDAFTDVPFRGNPAAVCLLDAAASEVWMQDLAREMNLSETAFVVPRADGDFDLRWFTPVREIELCGHATLGSAHALFEWGHEAAAIRFHTQSGVLTCTPNGARIEMDFPSAPPHPIDAPAGLFDALGIDDAIALSESMNRWFVVELASEAAVVDIAPDFTALAAIGSGAVIVTARASHADADITSRVFVPGAGIDEDPVTGSAHCSLVPYWAAKLQKTEIVAYQASARGGTLWCRLARDRVFLAGHAVTVLRAGLQV